MYGKFIMGKQRSKFEATVNNKLKIKNVDFKHEPFYLPYVTEALYLPDFVVNGMIVIEAKGYFKPEDRRKMLDVKKFHPDLDIRLVFQRDNKLTKAKNGKTYTQWADQHGFKWAVGEVPNDWILEFKKEARKGITGVAAESRAAKRKPPKNK
jgi:hypothetical protein